MTTATADPLPVTRTDDKRFNVDWAHEAMSRYSDIVTCGTCGNDAWLLTVIALALDLGGVTYICNRCEARSDHQ